MNGNMTPNCSYQQVSPITMQQILQNQQKLFDLQAKLFDAEEKILRRLDGYDEILKRLDSYDEILKRLDIEIKIREEIRNIVSAGVHKNVAYSLSTGNTKHYDNNVSKGVIDQSDRVFETNEKKPNESVTRTLISEKNLIPENILDWVKSPFRNSDYTLALNDDIKKRLEVADGWDEEKLIDFANKTPSTDCALVTGSVQSDFIAKKDYYKGKECFFVLPKTKLFNKGKMAQSCCYKFFDLPSDLTQKNNKEYTVEQPAIFECINGQYVIKEKGKLR